MAKENEKKFEFSKNFSRRLDNINKLITQANLGLYGTTSIDDSTEELDIRFQKILNTHIGELTNRNTDDITSFLGQLVSNDNKTSAISNMLNNQFNSMGFGDDYSTVQSFIYEAYRNRLLEQSDLHEVASQLIELSEAILITRDAIVSANVVDGKMNRNLNFDNINEDDRTDSIPIIENMEKKFNLLHKIKNFVVPKTLEYGEYYAYVIPYSKLFNTFMSLKEHDVTGRFNVRESTILESFDEDSFKTHKIKEDSDKDFMCFIEKAYEKYTIQESTKYKSNKEENVDTLTKEDFASDMKNMLGNIVISNDDVPIPILEEGFDSIEFIKNKIEKYTTENTKAKNLFDKVNKKDNKKNKDGIYTTVDNESHEFDDIEDCYLKMLDPTKVIPIKIMDTVIGYYYVQDEDITPLGGAISNTLYYSKFDQHRKEGTVIDSIAERVVKSFNKSFLMNNIKFKQTIVDCINYYNLNEKRLKFQFIPAEYIQDFKIDEDINGDGQSMIKKSLFYAKLYLMLLLFKIMTIIINSNDQKVNYIKQSGIDKNVANKVQEIARIKQSRQINITDLFSYTTLINKVGNGSEMYIPTGRSGERPIETEILSGQDVQLHTDLMEMLKNAYILATGVPAAIINYMNEADYAKTVEQNNSKFNGRVVNYQLDFNPSITELYKKLMRWSTNLPESVIENFEFSFQSPKSVTISTKGELISQFQAVTDFLTQILFEDPNQAVDSASLNSVIREFKILYAKDQLPMLKLEEVEELIETAKINVLEKKLTPDPANGDSGDDGFELDDGADDGM